MPKPWQCHYNATIRIRESIFTSHMQTALIDANEFSFNNWRILSTNGYNLCPSPVGFVNLSFISLYDEYLWRSDERFCLWRLLSSLTKGYAEWPIGVQSVLLICQPVMNTADGLYWMPNAECAVQLVIDNWPSRNAKRCSGRLLTTPISDKEADFIPLESSESNGPILKGLTHLSIRFELR